MLRTRRFNRLLPVLLLALSLAPGCASALGSGARAGSPPGPDYTIYDAEAGRFLASVEELSSRLGGSELILFGEFHDDPGTHRVQQQLLERLAAGERPLIVGFEMFERDVQPLLDHYRAGLISEADLLERARPWPNYETDYRPLLEFASARGWPVLATNAPQAVVGRVAREGLAALERLEPLERSAAAASIECPVDEYWDRFLEAIGAADDPEAHTPGGGMMNVYLAQCIRDETMAETIADQLRPEATLFHLNGGFHSDYRLGIVPRVLRRSPGAQIRTLSAIPVEDPRRIDLREYAGRADFLIFTRELPDP